MTTNLNINAGDASTDVAVCADVVNITLENPVFHRQMLARYPRRGLVCLLQFRCSFVRPGSCLTDGDLRYILINTRHKQHPRTEFDIKRFGGSAPESSSTTTNKYNERKRQKIQSGNGRWTKQHRTTARTTKGRPKTKSKR